jgi:hypothetical protein
MAVLVVAGLEVVVEETLVVMLEAYMVEAVEVTAQLVL